MSSRSVPGALRTAAYAAYFPLLLAALFALPAILLEFGVSLLDAVQYALFAVTAAYVVGLGALCR